MWIERGWQHLTLARAAAADAVVDPQSTRLTGGGGDAAVSQQFRVERTTRAQTGGVPRCLSVATDGNIKIVDV